MKANTRKNNLQAYFFLAPFLAFTVVLYIIPAILTVAMAFTSLDSAFIWKFVGLSNFARVFKDPNTPIILRNTVFYVVVTISLTILLDLFFAVMTTYFIQSDAKGSVFKAILMIPMITPAVVYSVLWLWLLGADAGSLMNQVWMTLGGREAVNWIAQYPFAVVIIATILTSIAYGTTIFSSAIRSIPENQFRAARVDGAGEWEIVKTIILPNLRFHILFISLWETLGLLTNYVTIMLITNGGPGIQTEIWALSSYHKAFSDSRYGYGAAISVLLILVVMLLMILIAMVLKKQEGRSQS